MNLLRELHQAQVFRLLAQDLAGLLTVERLADHLSALADAVLERRSAWSGATCAPRHRQDAPRFAVIAYGKLGGKELGYASDLDIIFLYDDADERAGEVYARLAQRLNHWLTSRTSSGILFETDLALRPSGASGLLVSPVAAFERYQEESAWTWEHQALTRARYLAPATGAWAKDSRRSAKRSCDGRAISTRLASEILAMREKLHAAHPNRSRPVRPQARPRRHDRHRVRGAVPGARRMRIATPISPATSATSRCSGMAAGARAARRGARRALPTTPIAISAGCSTRCA